MQPNFVIHNRLQDVIRNKEKEGFLFKPNNQFYTKLRIHKRKFGQFIRNEKQPTIDELARIASTLSVEFHELINNEKQINYHETEITE